MSNFNDSPQVKVGNAGAKIAKRKLEGLGYSFSAPPVIYDSDATPVDYLITTPVTNKKNYIEFKTYRQKNYRGVQVFAFSNDNFTRLQVFADNHNDFATVIYIVDMSKDFNRSIENDPCIFWAWFQSLRDFINNKFIVDDVQFPVYETRPVYKNNNWTEEEFVYFPVSLFQIAFYLDDEERQILKKLICDMDAQIPKRKFTETSAERQKEWINKMDIAEKNALNLIPPSNSSKPETKIPVAYFTQIESRAQQFKRYGLGASSALITAVKFVADEEQIDLSPILHFVNFIGDFIKQEQEEDEENFIERMLQNE